MGCVSSVPAANLDIIQTALLESKQAFLLHDGENHNPFYKQCKIQSYQDGDVLYNESDPTGFLFLIRSGLVQVVDNCGSAEMYGACDLLGERAYGNNRDIYGERAVCVGAVEVIVVSFTSLDRFIANISAPLQNDEGESVDRVMVCKATLRHSRQDILRNVSFLFGCNDSSLNALTHSMEIVCVGANTELIALHSSERFFFVLVYGHVRITSGGTSGTVPNSPVSSSVTGSALSSPRVSIFHNPTTNNSAGYTETFGLPTHNDVFSVNEMYGGSPSSSPASPSLARMLNRPRTSIQKENSVPKTERPYVLHAGQFFGELSFVVDIPYPHSASSTGPCVLLKISYDAFQQVCTKHEELSQAMNMQVQNHIANHQQFSSVPFFNNIPAERLLALGLRSKVVQQPKDAIVVTQGEVSTCLYILIFGKVDVLVDGQLIATLKPGQYFGEVGLVMDTPRTATVATQTASILMAISRADFAECFESYPDAYAEFSIKLLRHSVPVNCILAHPLGRESLERFCSKEHSRENFDFYIAVQEFKLNFANTTRNTVTTVMTTDNVLMNDTAYYDNTYDDMVEEAREIWDMYIAPGTAEKEVNLKSQNIKAVKAVLFNTDLGDDGLPENVHCTLFDACQREILFLMRDTQHRFVHDAIFEELLLRLGSYENKKPVDQGFVSKLASTLNKRQSDPLAVNIPTSSTIDLPPMIVESPSSQFEDSSCQSQIFVQVE